MLAALAGGICIAPSVVAQANARTPASAVAAAPSRPKVRRSPAIFDPTVLNLSLLIAPPPSPDSDAGRAERAELHQLESTRTPEQIAAAQMDDKREDFTIYSVILGSKFNLAALLAVGRLSTDVLADAGSVIPPLKSLYARPRPFDFDMSLHPVCEINHDGSYPSGHAFGGFISAYILVQMVPERKDDILARAEDYTHNRMVCGVHYRSDIEATRRVTLALIAYYLANPRFQRELTDATAELRAQLQLGPLPKVLTAASINP